MDRLAGARQQAHAVLAARQQNRLAVHRSHEFAGCVLEIGFGIGAAAGRLKEFLAVRRQHRRAAIDGKIGAFRIDDDAFAEFLRLIDDIADDARGQRALGIIRQQHDVGVRQRRHGRRDHLLLDRSRDRLGHFPIGTQQMRGEMIRNKAHLSGRRPARIHDQPRIDSRLARKFRLQQFACRIRTDHADENAMRAERSDIAPDIARAADIHLAALNGDHRRGRFRRHALDVAIDELVEHEIADAQHGLASDIRGKSLEIEHGPILYVNSVAPGPGIPADMLCLTLPAGEVNAPDLDFRPRPQPPAERLERPIE